MVRRRKPKFVIVERSKLTGLARSLKRISARLEALRQVDITQNSEQIVSLVEQWIDEQERRSRNAQRDYDAAALVLSSKLNEELTPEQRMNE